MPRRWPARTQGFPPVAEEHVGDAGTVVAVVEEGGNKHAVAALVAPVPESEGHLDIGESASAACVPEAASSRGVRPLPPPTAPPPPAPPTPGPAPAGHGRSKAARARRRLAELRSKVDEQADASGHPDAASFCSASTALPVASTPWVRAVPFPVAEPSSSWSTAVPGGALGRAAWLLVTWLIVWAGARWGLQVRTLRSMEQLQTKVQHLEAQQEVAHCLDFAFGAQECTASDIPGHPANIAEAAAAADAAPAKQASGHVRRQPDHGAICGCDAAGVCDQGFEEAPATPPLPPRPPSRSPSPKWPPLLAAFDGLALAAEPGGLPSIDGNNVRPATVTAHNDEGAASPVAALRVRSASAVGGDTCEANRDGGDPFDESKASTMTPVSLDNSVKASEGHSGHVGILGCNPSGHGALDRGVSAWSDAKAALHTGAETRMCPCTAAGVGAAEQAHSGGLEELHSARRRAAATMAGALDWGRPAIVSHKMLAPAAAMSPSGAEKPARDVAPPTEAPSLWSGPASTLRRVVLGRKHWNGVPTRERHARSRAQKSATMAPDAPTASPMPMLMLASSRSEDPRSLAMARGVSVSVPAGGSAAVVAAETVTSAAGSHDGVDSPGSRAALFGRRRQRTGDLRSAAAGPFGQGFTSIIPAREANIRARGRGRRFVAVGDRRSFSGIVASGARTLARRVHELVPRMPSVTATATHRPVSATVGILRQSGSAALGVVAGVDDAESQTQVPPTSREVDLGPVVTTIVASALVGEAPRSCASRPSANRTFLGCGVAHLAAPHRSVAWQLFWRTRSGQSTDSTVGGFIRSGASGGSPRVALGSDPTVASFWRLTWAGIARRWCLEPSREDAGDTGADGESSATLTDGASEAVNQRPLSDAFSSPAEHGEMPPVPTRGTFATDSQASRRAFGESAPVVGPAGHGLSQLSPQPPPATELPPTLPSRPLPWSGPAARAAHPTNVVASLPSALSTWEVLRTPLAVQASTVSHASIVQASALPTPLPCTAARSTTWRLRWTGALPIASSSSDVIGASWRLPWATMAPLAVPPA
mmetsp:Transcript_96899/g.278856  ORF Transcript_96899/g.278856 Transcript_96899/m.278856 type:complete len:1051 (+) Transcript_96899:55-3207(+)